jgi:hypothetical protein
MSLTRRKTLPHRQRIPVILQGIWEGKNLAQIAKECGVTQRTIIRDRATATYQEQYEEWLAKYMTELNQLLNIHDEEGNQTHLKFVLKEKGKFIRSMIPRRVEARAEIIQAIIQPQFHPTIGGPRYVDPEDTKT